MRVFIVFAHHEQRSFNGALKSLAVSVLTEQHHAVKVSDLYAVKFNPVASKQDFLKLPDIQETNYMLMQKSTAQKGRFAKDIDDEQEKVRWADFILFQFPIWWFSPPAIMKGWFDRVLACGFAWDFAKTYSSGLLRGKKAMLSVTTGGGQEGYSEKGANLATINQMLHPIMHGTLYFCGMEVLPPFVAYGAFQVGDQGRKKYLEEFKQRLLTIETTQPLKSYSPIVGKK
nr:NAD(P)H-dependent oxidoreductase [Candidatus Njordarchaeota archaeon]